MTEYNELRDDIKDMRKEMRDGFASVREAHTQAIARVYDEIKSMPGSGKACVEHAMEIKELRQRRSSDGHKFWDTFKIILASGLGAALAFLAGKQ